MLRYVLPMFGITVTEEQSSKWIESVCVSDEWAETSGKYFVKGQPAPSSDER